jgi:CRP-like cAMP-binding protein
VARQPRDELPPRPRKIRPQRPLVAPAGRPPRAAAAAAPGDSWLGRDRLFATLPADALRLLEECMAEETFAAGSLLLSQGEPGTALLVVCDGQVEISVCDGGEQRHVISQCGPGDVLGEMALLTAEPRTADARALTPVRARILPAESFHRLARESPEISVVLTDLVAARLGRAGRDALAGKTLAGYQIIRRLGRGGMAVVYEAREAATRRRVALKMMSHRLVYDRNAQARFQREADLIESFRHENIIRLFGRFAAFHTWFMVMEFCDGRSLDVLIEERGRLPADACRRIVGQLARGLLHAHAAGVVHRDLKPSNVLVSHTGTVQLSDFGLALTAVEGDSPRVIVGTPQYMSPEQLAGEPVDRRTDYFALGCVLWEMLTGAPLVPESRLEDIMRRHAAWSVPVPPDDLTAVDPLLMELLQQCLQRSAADRRVDLEAVAGWAAPLDALAAGA